MKRSITIFLKPINILIILLIFLIIAVNIVTVNNLVSDKKHHNQPNDRQVELADKQIDKNDEYSVFGKPNKIILYGNGTSLTIEETDNCFNEILRMNEHRCSYIPELKVANEFEINTSDFFYIEYVYTEKYDIKFHSFTAENVSSAVFLLTGNNHGSIKLNSDGNDRYVGKLTVNPELIVKVVDMLSDS